MATTGRSSDALSSGPRRNRHRRNARLSSGDRALADIAGIGLPPKGTRPMNTLEDDLRAMYRRRTAHLPTVGKGLSVTTTAATTTPIADDQEDFIMLKAAGSRRSNRRIRNFVLAGAACAAAVVAIVMVARPNHQSPDGGTLTDVDATEALPLAHAAQIDPHDLGEGWTQVDHFGGSTYANTTAAIIEARPECAQAKSFGLLPPTTKSATAHQDFYNVPVPMIHDVWVFATPADASHAMDFIAGDVFSSCFFDLWDQMTPLVGLPVNATSKSEEWSAPSIGQHGDRQVIIGQRIHYIFVGDPPEDVEAVNAFVQVGRAIAVVDPKYVGDVGPTSNVEKAITLSTDALKKVFGG